AERGDVVILVDALEPGDDDDVPLFQGPVHARRRNALDSRLGVGAVGDDADLGARKTEGALAERVDRHRQQRNGNLLAGRQQHVHLTRRRVLTDLVSQLDQFIGGIAAGADDDYHLVAVLVSTDGTACRRPDPLRPRHTGSAELLYDQSQGISPLWAGPIRGKSALSYAATPIPATTSGTVATACLGERGLDSLPMVAYMPRPLLQSHAARATAGRAATSRRPQGTS